MKSMLVHSMILVATIVLLAGKVFAKDNSCSMASEGLYDGAWVKHRIISGEQVLAGANDMNSIALHLESLREQGFCR